MFCILLKFPTISDGKQFIFGRARGVRDVILITDFR